MYNISHRQFCPNMKKVTLDKVEHALESMTSTVELSDDIILEARKPLQRMLELS